MGVEVDPEGAGPNKSMYAEAVVIRERRRPSLERAELIQASDGDLMVESLYSGISTGTEKLLFDGTMPAFPGLAYPLVPGYETVGRVAGAGRENAHRIGEMVFVPGTRGFTGLACLFGATASRLIVPAERAVPVPEGLGLDGTLLALAATAHNAIATSGAPELVIGHGVLGRICARLAIALGFPAPMVWETSKARRDGARGYPVSSEAEDGRRDYKRILDVSGDPAILDAAIAHLGRDGEVTLAGFYANPLSFSFPPAFMRRARIRIAAEFVPNDIAAVLGLIASGNLVLNGLITHCEPASDACDAYPRAFATGDCLKMVLDWRR